MAAIGRMPGNWPLENTERSSMNDRLDVPRIITNFGQLSLQIPTLSSASSSRNSRDELFFDCNQLSANSEVDENAMQLYLAFEPVVDSVSSEELIDLRRYEHPKELLEVTAGTCIEIQDLLRRSIERIGLRHEEEERAQIAAARRERPIARVGRASVKPQRKHIERLSPDLGPLSSSIGDSGSSSSVAGPSRLSGASATSFNDSGHASMLLEPGHEAEVSPHLKPVTRRTRGFSGLFRGKNRASESDFDRVSMSSVSSASSIHGSPQRAAPTPQPTLEPTGMEVECVSCLDDFASSDMIKLSCHSYCTDCFARLVDTALVSETQWPVKCCLNPIPSTIILPHLSDATKKMFQQRDAEWSIPTSDRIYCHHAKCSSWIPPKKINPTKRYAKCSKCSKRTCTLCRGAHHNGIDCPNDPSLLATVHLAELEGWKRCYQCKAYVEHNKGCRHMTCRCKAQFCYICSAKWRSCACTDEQLNVIQQQVAARRAAATTLSLRSAAEVARREAADEEDRIILQMVADFERVEAERMADEAEAVRLIEEAERRVRDEQRREREAERIALVNLRFRQLNVELEALHDVQRVRILERHDFETEMLHKDRQDALDRLAITQPGEIQSLNAESQRKIMDAETKFEQEYQVRLAEERSIEDDYVAQLRAFYAGKPEAEYHIRDARDELRLDQDKEYRFWDAYRRTQVLAVREGESRKVEATRVRHASERKAVEGRAKIDEVEYKRKVRADLKWVEVVVVERSAMLLEKEQEEYAVEV